MDVGKQHLTYQDYMALAKRCIGKTSRTRKLCKGSSSGPTNKNIYQRQQLMRGRTSCRNRGQLRKRHARASRPMSTSKGKPGKIGRLERRKTLFQSNDEDDETRYSPHQISWQGKEGLPGSARQSGMKRLQVHSQRQCTQELIRYERRRRKTPINFSNIIRKNPIQDAGLPKDPQKARK